MARISCLAGIDRDKVALLVAVLKLAGAPLRAIVARLDVVTIRKVQPSLLICDIDHVAADPLELLRQLRFTLPLCVIVVYTMELKRSWCFSCHLAGANGLIAKASSSSELALGVRGALRTGSFTDPRFAAA